MLRPAPTRNRLRGRRRPNIPKVVSSLARTLPRSSDLRKREVTGNKCALTPMAERYGFEQVKLPANVAGKSSQFRGLLSSIANQSPRHLRSCALVRPESSRSGLLWTRRMASLDVTRASGGPRRPPSWRTRIDGPAAANDGSSGCSRPARLHQRNAVLIHRVGEHLAEAGAKGVEERARLRPGRRVALAFDFGLGVASRFNEAEEARRRRPSERQVGTFHRPPFDADSAAIEDDSPIEFPIFEHPERGDARAASMLADVSIASRQDERASDHPPRRPFGKGRESEIRIPLNIGRCRIHSPNHTGLRFSRKAEMPSRKSAVPRISALAAIACSSSRSSSRSEKPTISRLVWTSAKGLSEASSCANPFARSMSLSAGTTSLTKPIRQASSAPISFPERS